MVKGHSHMQAAAHHAACPRLGCSDNSQGRLRLAVQLSCHGDPTGSRAKALTTRASLDLSLLLKGKLGLMLSVPTKASVL